MKIIYLLLVSSLSLVLAVPQFKPQFQADKQFPQIVTSGGGTLKQGSFNVDARQQIWQSPNKRHSFDASGGYSRNWGDPNPINNQKNYRLGAGYTFRF